MREPRRVLALMGLGCLLGLLPGTARAAPGAGQAEPWLFLPWDDAVGRIVGSEADSEGPKSFAVKPDGGVLLLDQVNLRVLNLDEDGGLLGTIDLPGSTFDDVEQYEGRAVLALDRLVAKTLLVMDMQGTHLAEVTLEGRGIERSGLITALLPRKDGVWLEVRHRYSVKVLDSRLQPCERQILLGRPLEQGRSLHGALDGAGGVSLWTSRRNARSSLHSVTLSGQDPVRRIVWLDEDDLGAVYAVLHEALFAATSPYRVQDERYQLVVLDEGLGELARLQSPWVLTSYDQRVELRVGPGRRLWQMAFVPDGVLLLRWDWRAP
ncbi:MAG: hypothetical protein ABI333_21655 [bacterium]